MSVERGAGVLERTTHLALAAALATSVLVGCSGQSSPAQAPAPAAAAKHFAAPVDARLAQRSEVHLPLSRPVLTVRVGDVTRGKVTVTVVTIDEVPLAGPRSMGADETLEVQLAREVITLRVTKLENALVGEDFVHVRLEPEGSEGEVAVVDEVARIELLLQDLASAQSVRFIRNDSEYSATDAAAHLRMKWNGGRSEIDSAEQFIELCGTRSGASGELYRVRLADGREQPSAEFLRDLLRARDAQ